MQYNGHPAGEFNSNYAASKGFKVEILETDCLKFPWLEITFFQEEVHLYLKRAFINTSGQGCQDWYSRGKKISTPIRKALCKWGHFEREALIFKKMSVFWEEIILPTRSKSFQRGTVGLCKSKGCKVTRFHVWRFEKEFYCLAWVKPHSCSLDSTSGQLDCLQSLMDHNFVAFLPKETYSTISERPWFWF